MKLKRFRSPQKNLPREPHIRINNCKIKLHSCVKYLGILIYEVLSWNKQIEFICMKLASVNGTLSKLRYFVFTVVWFGPILEKAILIV